MPSGPFNYFFCRDRHEFKFLLPGPIAQFRIVKHAFITEGKLTGSFPKFSFE